MRVLIAVIVTLLVVPVASAAKEKAVVTSTIAPKHALVTAVITGTPKPPKTVRVRYGKTVVPLRRLSANRKRSVWRSPKLTGARRTAVAAKKTMRVRVVMNLAGKARTVPAVARITKIQRPKTTKPPAPTTPPPGAPAPTTPQPPGQPAPPGGPTPPPPTPPPSEPVSLFGTPATQLVGNEPVAALTPYVLNASFTTCVAGWPNCAVEERYSFLANGDHWYCRLTMSSGSDIRSSLSIQGVTGAQQETNGAWAFSYTVSTGSSPAHYRWDVTPTGQATGYYWYNRDPSSPLGPTEVMSNFQWVRGAKDCSY